VSTAVVVALALAAGGAASRQESGAHAVSPCSPAGGQTIAQDSEARVYSVGHNVYGCVLSTGATHKLGMNSFCNDGNAVDHVALAGTVTAYGIDACGIDTGTTTVFVRQLVTGEVLHRNAATSRVTVEGYGAIGSIVVKPDGSDAWIGLNHSIVRSDTVTEVHKDDHGGSSLLDSGRRVHPGSLTLARSQLSWIDGGSTRHATLR
jgi:hypothetical protein